jgi:lysophospholipase L1-like esterase
MSAKANRSGSADQGRAESRPAGEWRARLLLVFFSLAVTALFLELALRILGMGAPPALGKGAFDYFTFDETLGWELTPGAGGRLASGEFDVAIRINGHGERSDYEIPLERTPGKTRLLAIGDSFSFGHGVEAAEAWPARLAGLLPDTEVVNLAVTGYGTDQQVLRLEKQGLAYKPDVVILGLFEGNVFRNLKREQMGYPKPLFELEDGKLELRGVPLPRLAEGETYASAMPFSRLWALAGGRAIELFRHLGFGKSWPLTGAILERFAADCRKVGAEPRVVLIPKDRAVDAPGWRGAIHRRTLREIEELSKSRGLATLDLTPVLAAQLEKDGQPLYFPVDGHWNAAGHQAAAQAIADWLEPRHVTN